MERGNICLVSLEPSAGHVTVLPQIVDHVAGADYRCGQRSGAVTNGHHRPAAVSSLSSPKAIEIILRASARKTDHAIWVDSE